MGLGPLDVGRGGPTVDQVTGVEQIEVVIHLLLLGRAGEDHARAVLTKILDQLAGAIHRLDFADQLTVGIALGGTDFVPGGILTFLADQRRDDLVAAHADVAVDLP